MTREEAQKYIEKLTYAEKKQLNDLLKALAQKRPPVSFRPGSAKPTGR